MHALDVTTLIDVALPAAISASVALVVTRWQLKRSSEIEEGRRRDLREREYREQQSRLASLYSDLRDAEDRMWHFITNELYGLVHAGATPSEATISRVQREANERFQSIASVSRRLELTDPCDARVKQLWETVSALDIALCYVRGLRPGGGQWGADESYRELGQIKHLGPEWTKKRNELSLRLRRDFTQYRLDHGERQAAQVE